MRWAHRYRLINELKEQQRDADGVRRADTASLDTSGLQPVIHDGKIVGWVNSERAAQTRRPRTRFPSPPALPFAQNKRYVKPNGQVIEFTQVYHIPKYGATLNSQYGTTFHQKAIPEHWQRPKQEAFPGTVAHASAGHLLKDDGYWDFGHGRPSRIGRPIWHSFAGQDQPRGERDAGDGAASHVHRQVGTAMTERGNTASSLRGATAASSLSAKEVGDMARQVERKADEAIQAARTHILGLKWVRSLGFVRDRDPVKDQPDASEFWPRPDTRVMRTLIPKDQRRPTAAQPRIARASRAAEPKGADEKRSDGAMTACRPGPPGPVQPMEPERIEQASLAMRDSNGSAKQVTQRKLLSPSLAGLPATYNPVILHTQQRQPLPKAQSRLSATAVARDKQKRAQEFLVERRDFLRRQGRQPDQSSKCLALNQTL